VLAILSSGGGSLLALTIPLAAYAQSQPTMVGEWTAVMNLQPRVQLRVAKNDGKIVMGLLQEASDSVIVLSHPRARISIMRSDVRRVCKSCPGASLRRSILKLVSVADSATHGHTG
jgi:hypothetical protein